MRISDWSSDVCSSDLARCGALHVGGAGRLAGNVLDLSHAGIASLERLDALRLGLDDFPLGRVVGLLGAVGHERDLEPVRVGLVELVTLAQDAALEIGRASCRARVCTYV